MFGFWLMFVVAAWAVLAPYRLTGRGTLMAWWAVGVLFALMMGLRYEVGGDWSAYLVHFEYAAQRSFSEVLEYGDPGHYVLNWLVAQLGGDIYWVNLLYACILTWGTVVFCRRQPLPWLALLVAVPYMLVVVGMGYSRQAVALGFALLGLTALGEHRVRMFVVYIVLGALFHKSAVLLLPIAALAATRNRLLTGAMVLVVTALMYFLLVEESADALWTNYVESQRESEGGAIRVAMNAVPAVVLLIFRKSLVPDEQQRKLWSWISILALVCVPLVPLASTAVDRVALYLIPLQLYVFARLPMLAGQNAGFRTMLVLGVVGYYLAVQYVWLNYATHAQYWLPYQFAPFV